MKVKFVGGKVLTNRGRVVTNLGCCCGFTPDCTCPRDAYEITGFTISGSATFTPCSACTDACSSLTCSYTQTWTRISYLDSFSAPNQFKIWIDASCNVNYDDNRTASPISVDCSVFGPHYIDFGIDNLHASINLTPFSFSTPLPVLFALHFFPEGDSGCFFDTCAPVFDASIQVDHCDLTPILGTHTVSDSVTDANGSVMQASGSVEIF